MLVKSTRFYLYFEYLACYMLMNEHIIYELCCCLFLWIILRSSSYSMTSHEKHCASYHLTAEYGTAQPQGNEGSQVTLESLASGMRVACELR